MVNNSSRKGAASVSPALIAVAVVVLVVLVGLMAYRAFGPGQAPRGGARALTPQQVSDDAWLAQEAAQSAGDLSRLRPEDQQRAQRITSGHAGMALGALYAAAKRH